jgi:hypothetical protein
MDTPHLDDSSERNRQSMNNKRRITRSMTKNEMPKKIHFFLDREEEYVSNIQSVEQWRQACDKYNDMLKYPEMKEIALFYLRKLDNRLIQSNLNNLGNRKDAAIQGKRCVVHIAIDDCEEAKKDIKSLNLDLLDEIHLFSSRRALLTVTGPEERWIRLRNKNYKWLTEIVNVSSPNVLQKI